MSEVTWGNCADHRRTDAEQQARLASQFRPIVDVGRLMLLRISGPEILRKNERAMTRRSIGERV